MSLSDWISSGINQASADRASIPQAAAPSAASLTPGATGAAGMISGALPWANFGLNAAGTVAGGIDAYLSYQEKKRKEKLEEKLMLDQNRRAEQQQQQEFKAYNDGTVQRGANVLATLAPVVSQGQTYRDRLLQLRGGI